MKTWRVSVLSVVAATLGAAAFFVARPAVGADDEIAGVRKSCEAVVSGWNKHDAKAIAAVFAEDADMISPEGKLVSGRAAIEKAFTEDMNGPLKESAITVLKEPVRFPTPEIAVSDAEVTLEGAIGPDGAKSGPMTLIVTNVWKKADGKWWIYASRPRFKTPPPSAK
jgi:uncharacterized protein (TIGR02246 family)